MKFRYMVTKMVEEVYEFDIEEVDPSDIEENRHELMDYANEMAECGNAKLVEQYTIDIMDEDIEEVE